MSSVKAYYDSGATASAADSLFHHFRKGSVCILPSGSQPDFCLVGFILFVLCCNHFVL